MIGLDLLRRELWDLLLFDGGDSVRELLSLKRREDRRGRMKRLLSRAIRSSSLGVFCGQMYYFGGKVYELLERSVFNNLLYDLMSERVNLPDGDLVKLSDIYVDCCNVVMSKPLRVSNNIMIFRNGVLDVERGVFSKRFDKRFVQMWSVDYDYVAGQGTFLWHQFINQVLPEEHWRDALQMFLGATFIDRDRAKIEHILVLLGKSGANGKSVIHRVVCGVLGNDYVSSHEIGRLCKSGLEGDSAVADINGKRLNYCSEMSESDFFRRGARFKALVSGESVTACFKHCNPFKAMNIPLLMANTNILPSFNRSDTAMLRRIYVIPFQVTIPEEKQNKTLGDELVAEYPGILNWILEGRKKFIENGYRLPESIGLDKYVTDEDAEFCTVLKFMRLHNYLPRIEGVHVSPFVWIRATELYNDYARWCRQNELEAVGRTAFLHMLVNNYGYRRERKARGFMIAVFGTHIDKLKKIHAERRDGGLPKPSLLWVKGVGYAMNLTQLATFVGASLHVVKSLNARGLFKEYTRAYRNRSVYGVDGIRQVLRDHHVLASDEEREVLNRLRLDAKYRRNLFNRTQKKRGWPYRMYDNDAPQLEEGIIVVPEYTTDDEVIEMAKAAGLRTAGVRGAYGAYALGGKGDLRDASEIPTEEEIERFKNNDNDND